MTSPKDLQGLSLGDPRRPPVVLLHGFPLDGRMWKPVAERLAPSFSVHVPDLAGFGASPALPGAWSLEEQGEAVWRWVRRREARPFALAGFSMGGYVALALAEKHPRSLAALSLVDSRAAADSPEAARRRLEDARRVEAEGTAPFLEDFLPRLFAPNTLRERRGLVVAVRKIAGDQPPATVAAALRAMAARPSRLEVVRSLSVPFLVLAGREDRLTPAEEGRALAAEAPLGAFHEIRGAGHLAPLEAPEAVHRALASFFREAFPPG
ncbi:MAG: alpha/beta fold hydrolase [Acidobacteriota bacterium]